MFYLITEDTNPCFYPAVNLVIYDMTMYVILYTQSRL
jgi:hypothetical protein